MSAFIGDLRNGIGVWASRTSVEIAVDREHAITPIEARNLAALLVRAADECERMRAKPDGGMCDFALPTPTTKELTALLDAALAFARSQRP